jgi:hypothetical protein
MRIAAPSRIAQLTGAAISGAPPGSDARPGGGIGTSAFELLADGE